MASPSGSANGGIIGKTNTTSFGKNKVTSKTSSGAVTTQPGTRLIDYLVVAGGGGGGYAWMIGAALGAIIHMAISGRGK